MDKQKERSKKEKREEERLIQKSIAECLSVLHPLSTFVMSAEPHS